MKKQAIYLTDLHFEHENWISELAFQRDELKIFKNRLAEVVPRYTDTEILAQGEQYQNQMIRYNEVIDQLLHDINQHEHQISTYAIEHPVAIDHVHFDDHGGLREQMEMQRKIYANFKKDYFRFLTKYM